MTTMLLPPISSPLAQLDDRAFRAEVASGKPVGRRDAVDFLHAGQHFDFAGIEIGARADAAEHSLECSGGAVYFKAHLDQLIDHVLNLIFTGGILHGYDHVCSLDLWLGGRGPSTVLGIRLASLRMTSFRMMLLQMTSLRMTTLLNSGSLAPPSILELRIEFGFAPVGAGRARFRVSGCPASRP